jgi:hypothetical protein
MGANEMVVQPEPFAVEEQMTLSLSISPCASREGGDGLTEGEVDALDERGLDERAESRLA